MSLTVIILVAAVVLLASAALTLLFAPFLGKQDYDGAKAPAGAIVISESPDGLVYRLELAGDPENLMFEKEVTFIVVPPDYKRLLSQ